MSVTRRRKRLAPLTRRDRVAVGRPRASVEQLERGLRRAAQLIDAAIVGYAIEPWTQRELAVARPEAGVGPDEDILQRILDIQAPAREHLAHVAGQLRPVAVVDDAERLLAARPEERDELLV